MIRRGLKLAALLSLLTAMVFAETIPSGTPITIRMGQELNSGKTKTGQHFNATLTRDLVVHGKTMAPAGTPARGKVTYVKTSGRLHDPGQLTIRLTSLQLKGKTVAISSSAYHVEGKSHTKSNVTKIGGGTAAGALIGGIAGGGKGALIGAGAGAAAGTGVAAATGKQEAEIPAERAVTFKTTAAATVN
jgi:hypothetical protein